MFNKVDSYFVLLSLIQPNVLGMLQGKILKSNLKNYYFYFVQLWANAFTLFLSLNSVIIHPVGLFTCPSFGIYSML